MHKVSINYGVNERASVLSDIQIEELIDAKCKDSDIPKTHVQIELMRDFIIKNSYNK